MQPGICIRNRFIADALMCGQFFKINILRVEHLARLGSPASEIFSHPEIERALNFELPKDARSLLVKLTQVIRISSSVDEPRISLMEVGPRLESIIFKACKRGIFASAFKSLR